MTDKKLRALSIDIKIDDYWITWNCYKFQLFSLNFTDLGGGQQRLKIDHYCQRQN